MQCSVFITTTYVGGKINDVFNIEGNCQILNSVLIIRMALRKRVHK